MSTNSQSIVKTRMMFKEEFEKLRKIKMRLFISLIFIYFGVISAMILFGLYYLKTKNVRWFYVFLFLVVNFIITILYDKFILSKNRERLQKDLNDKTVEKTKGKIDQVSSGKISGVKIGSIFYQSFYDEHKNIKINDIVELSCSQNAKILLDITKNNGAE